MDEIAEHSSLPRVPTRDWTILIPIGFSVRKDPRPINVERTCIPAVAEWGQICCGSTIHGGRSAMASKALTDQVAAKWQDSFNRLNRGAPGISGLMGFSRVRDLHRTQLGVSLFNSETWRCSLPSFLSRPGQLLQMFCTPESLERLRRTLVSVCVLSDACAG